MLQELVDKVPQMPKDVQWHFVGHLQSNKVKFLLEGCPSLSMLETVDSVKLANKLNKVVEGMDREPLAVLIQVRPTVRHSHQHVCTSASCRHVNLCYVHLLLFVTRTCITMHRAYIALLHTNANIFCRCSVASSHGITLIRHTNARSEPWPLACFTAAHTGRAHIQLCHCRSWSCGYSFMRNLFTGWLTLQVNTSREESKFGIDPGNVAELAKHIAKECPHLKLAGLLTIGQPDYSSRPENFTKLAECREAAAEATGVDAGSLELSMGMSADFEQAIEMGSTNVRVGSTIFGAREYSKS
jgi:uncharacterized pyridoxal phosphate-containing UPF0001 family protein